MPDFSPERMQITNKIQKETRKLVEKIAQLAAELNVNVFIVGGFVRDLYLKHAGKDIDFVVLDNALKFAEAFKAKYGSSSLVLYPKFGTAMLYYKAYKLEFVTARSEVYQKDSRKPDVGRADLHGDLKRRDFTINTMAMCIDESCWGKIIDPYNGLDDIKSRIVKTPLDPLVTFSDDPLRMMRAIRFATRFSFKIEPDTFSAIQKTAHRLEIVSQERITEEFNKIISGNNPALGIKLLDTSGLLAIFLPEFIKTKGIEQRDDYHHKDVFYHTLQVLDKITALSNKLDLRLAALFHDIAKPRTKRFDQNSGWTFHGHEVVGERMTAAIMYRMKYPGNMIDYVRKIVRLHLRPMALVDNVVTDSAIRRLLFLAGEAFDDLMTLCRADITSKNPKTVKRHLNNYKIVLAKALDLEERDKIKAFKSQVSGNEIMDLFNIEPGPLVGKIKKNVEEAILDGIIPNDHDAAFNYLLKNKKEFDKINESNERDKKPL